MIDPLTMSPLNREEQPPRTTVAHTESFNIERTFGPLIEAWGRSASIEGQGDRTSMINIGGKLCRDYPDRVTFLRANAFRFTARKQYRLLWCAGLFDYLNDNSFKALLRRLYGFVCEGGEIVIGNLSDNNPTRNYMELLGEWFLHHRCREQLLALARECGIPDSALSVGQEEEGVNLFLHIKR